MGRRRNTRKKNKVNIPLIITLSIFCLLIIAGIVGLSKMAAHENKVESTAGHIPDLEKAKIESGYSSRYVMKDYEGFTVCYDIENHNPAWVGWELLRSEADGDVARTNKFWHDDDVAGCAFTEDYKNSGYDRGHLCPAADQKWSYQAMRDCFSMANMTPQKHELNGGAWQTLEKKERAWAERDSAIVIVSGPIYTDADRQRIGDTGVRVPSAFFKVMLAPYLEEPRAIGFVYPNGLAPGNMQDYSMSVDEVERIVGMDFFSNLPDDVEDKVEATASFKAWNKR